jgi:hypothetical protein
MAPSMSDETKSMSMVFVCVIVVNIYYQSYHEGEMHLSRQYVLASGVYQVHLLRCQEYEERSLFCIHLWEQTPRLQAILLRCYSREYETLP